MRRPQSWIPIESLAAALTNAFLYPMIGWCGMLLEGASASIP
jgi:hypothetical protein